MMRRFILTMLLALTAAAEDFGTPPANPALARFSDRVTFLASFDHGEPAAEMAAGRHAPRSIQGEPAFVPGLYGQALTGGAIQYHGESNFPFQATGTILFWVCPVDWRERDDEGYQWWFQSGGKTSSLLIGRQGEIKGTRRATVYYHAASPGHKAGGEHVGGGGWRTWANGSWHLVAVTWQLGRIAISVDGAKPRGGQVGTLDSQAWFLVGRKQGESGRFLIDEFMILNRVLTPDEIAWIWQQSKP